MIFTKQQFVNSYNNLCNQAQKNEANLYILQLTNSDQAWSISRELLQSNNNQEQFLGVQMLHKRTQSHFHQLNAEQQNELTAYVFTLLFDTCETGFKPVISKLAATCAIIIAHNGHNESTLDSFLTQLTQAMKKSVFALRAGLFVLQQIPNQCKQLNNNNWMQKKVIRNTILSKQKYLVNLFLSIFQTKDQQSILRNLQTLTSWANFGLSIMSSPDLVTQILLHSANSLSNLDHATQIFGFTFKYHFYADAQEVDSITFTKQQLDNNYLSSIIIIVKFILDAIKFISQQPNSEYMYMQGYLVKQLLLYHPWIIGEDLTEVGQPLLQFMLIVLDQKSLKISLIALDFWKQLYQKVISFESIQSGIIKAYEIVYDKLLKKTLRNNLPKHLIKQTQQQVFDDQTDDGDVGTQKVTFQKYRMQASFVYQTIIIALKKSPSTIDLFFKKIYNLLQSNDECQIQLGLFVAYSTMVIIKDQTHDFIPNIIDYCCGFINANPNIKNQVIKLLSQLMDQIRIYNKFQNVLVIIINYLTDTELSQLASKTFDDLMRQMPQHTNISLVEQLIQNCNNNLRTLKNTSLFTKILSGVLILIQKLIDGELSLNYLKILVQNSINNLNNVITNSQVSAQSLEMCLNEVDLYLDHFQLLQKQKHVSASLTKSYYISIFNFLPKFLEVCKNANLKYTSMNSLGLITKIYIHIIKGLGIQSLSNTQIIDLSSSLSCINPKENCQLLKILYFTLEQFTKKSMSSNLIDNWISQNLVNFVEAYINVMQNTKDPDVVKNFYMVLDRIAKYNHVIFINLPNNIKLIEFALQILVNIVEARMPKYLLQFIITVIYIPNYNIQNLFKNIIIAIFQSLQNLGTSGYLPAAQILLKILNNYSEENLHNVIGQVIQQTKLKQFQKRQLIIKSLSFFIATHDEYSLRSALVLLGLTLKGFGQNEIMNLQIKYEAAKRALKNRK